ncbi:50S ribosomal protein L17 [Candidatus Sneabacter namystus]|uniref:Large ribosomal subunit protein bL17 n=1 Tax=Candidatus Sneabacter namystus TaxID=2601646 RepID=A0A5C0UIC7_9RICK|nr:50S ribosomal protein L17 [Candidatus Sneabacter namystus]QEK39500.1 50S ribosomal protein L17 [Candidatus Sneabacter namystus]
MRHKIGLKKLNRTTSHRLAMLTNMADALIMNEQIKTTIPKAKALRPYLEKLVTKAKVNTLQIRRKLLSLISEQSTNKLLDVLGPRYAKRPGGYLQIIRAGFRYGDSAAMAYIQFVDRDKKEKGKYNNENQSLVQKKVNQ